MLFRHQRHHENGNAHRKSSCNVRHEAHQSYTIYGFTLLSGLGLAAQFVFRLVLNGSLFVGMVLGAAHIVRLQRVVQIVFVAEGVNSVGSHRGYGI